MHRGVEQRVRRRPEVARRRVQAQEGRPVRQEQEGQGLVEHFLGGSVLKHNFDIHSLALAVNVVAARRKKE